MKITSKAIYYNDETVSDGIVLFTGTGTSYAGEDCIIDRSISLEGNTLIWATKDGTDNVVKIQNDHGIHPINLAEIDNQEDWANTEAGAQIAIRQIELWKKKSSVATDMVLTLPAADLGYSGITATYTAGENLQPGDLVYIDTDETVKKSSSADAATMPVIGIVCESIATGETGSILLYGYFRKDAWYKVVTSEIQYLADGSNMPSRDVPTTSGCIKQVLGIGMQAGIILFNPELTTVVVS